MLSVEAPFPVDNGISIGKNGNKLRSECVPFGIKLRVGPLYHIIKILIRDCLCHYYLS